MSGIYAQIHVKSGHGVCTISRKGLAAQYSCQRTVKLWVIFMLSYRLLDKTTVLRLSWCTLLLLTIWLRLSSRNIATWCWILYCFPRRSWEGHHLPFPGFGYTCTALARKGFPPKCWISAAYCFVGQVLKRAFESASGIVWSSCIASFI